MQLKSLSIDLIQYGVNEGRYTGVAHFKNQFGEVALNLDPDTSEAILEVVANKLVSSARSIGERLTAACVESAVPALLTKQAE